MTLIKALHWEEPARKRKRHPTIENNVMISAGAKILGSFTIGENSKVGAGSVVLFEVPPNSTVVGVPGRIVKRDNKRIQREDLDQVHLPDPFLNDIVSLKKENEYLKTELKKVCNRFDDIKRTCEKIDELDRLLTEYKDKTGGQNENL